MRFDAVQCIYYDCRCHFVTRLLFLLQRRLTAPSIIIFMCIIHRKWLLAVAFAGRSTAEETCACTLTPYALTADLFGATAKKWKTTQNQIIQVNCYELCCIKNNMYFFCSSVQKRVTSRDIEIKPNRIGKTRNRCWSRSQTSIGQMANKSSSKNHSVGHGGGCGSGSGGGGGHCSTRTYTINDV